MMPASAHAAPAGKVFPAGGKERGKTHAGW